MIRHFLLIVIAALLCVPTFGQNKYDGNYDILLKSGTEHFEANLNNFIQNPTITTAETVNGYFYRFLQFKTIPDQNTLQKIEQSGVILFDYVPHKTYIAGIPTTLDFNKMKKWSVRSIEKMTSLHKISKSALGPVFPEWAERGTNEIQLVVSYYRNIPAAKAQTLLTNANVNIIEMQPNSQTAIVQIAKAEIDNVAKLNFLYYVETIPEPAIPEYRPALSLHRANVINTMIPSGKHYDGDNVSILVRDDGEIGPHIDFHNRVFQDADPAAAGDHGDRVAGIMGGAGNIDPTIQGMAPASTIHVIDYAANFSSDNTLSLHQNDNVMVTNSSYSNGCNDGYITTTRVVDLQAFQNLSLLHVFSAGNSGTSNCGYGAGALWGNITGGHKIGKNVMAVASTDINGNVVNSSSRGPSEDGRIKPDIAAVGAAYTATTMNNAYNVQSGTSFSAPAIAGVATQLYHAYRELNNGQNPESALIKATLLNGAEDHGNPGPDFKYGYGIVNAYRSLEILENGDYLSASISQNGANAHTINVPANVKKVKVMTYWAENAAAVNSAVVLINDLDMTMTTPTGEVFLPWVLDHTPNATSLDADAVRGIDNLNNMEQVTLDNPIMGTYTVNISAPAGPSGNVNYYVVTTFIYDDITVVYPLGGEGLVPGTTERIHWDAYGNQSSFLIQFTPDDGVNWHTIANVNGTGRMFDWTVPNLVTGEAKVRIIRGNNTGESQANFSILGRPQNIVLDGVCDNYLRIEWDSLDSASSYDVFTLGYEFMDSIGTTTDTHYDIPINGNAIGTTYWVAVRGVGTNGLRGRRTNAAFFEITEFINCDNTNDIAVTAMLAPVAGYNSECFHNGAVIIEITNNSSIAHSNFPVSYEFNGNVFTETFTGSIPPFESRTHMFSTNLGILSVGNYNIIGWTSLMNEDFINNDTINTSFDIVQAIAVTAPFSENFDAMASCATASNCDATVCPLGNGWINFVNNSEDDIDWRVDANGTPTNGTGPSNDHTTGNGNYIYLEASGGCVGQEAVLVSPCIDLTNAVVPKLSFWYHMNGTGMGALHVDVYNGTQWLEDVFFIEGAQGNNWQEGLINLQPYTGGLINVRFRGVTGSSFASDIALDDIGVVEETLVPSAAFSVSSSVICQGTAVDLIDESVNISNAWTWTITPNTATFVNGTTANSQNPTVVFNSVGLYDIQLNVSNPNGADSTIQLGSITVENGSSIPYVEDFEALTYPSNLLIVNPDNSVTWQLGNATGSDGNSTQVTYMDNFVYNTSGEEDKMVIVLDLTSDTAASMTFDVSYTRRFAFFSDTLQIDIYSNCGQDYEGTVYHKGGADLATVPGQSTPFVPSAASHWRNDSVDLSAYVGSAIYLEFVNRNGYGNNLYIDNINIGNTPITIVNTGGSGNGGNGGNGSVPLDADFSASQGNLCIGQTVSAFDNSTGNVSSYTWDFGVDATPQTASGFGPHNFTYSSAGQKDIKLIVTSANGDIDSLSKNVTIQNNPNADFTLSKVNDSTIQVVNTSVSSNTIHWDFGDGNTATSANYIHTYDSTGTFTVTLSIDGNCGIDSFSQQVTTQLVNAKDVLKVAEHISVFPNPNNGRFTLQITGATKDLTLKIIDVQGRVLREWQEPNPTTNYTKSIDIQDFAQGVYFVQVQTNDGVDVVRIVKE